MPQTKDTPQYRLPTPGTALVEKECPNCLARFEYIQKTKYRDFCCDRCKTQYHNRRKTSAIVTTNISLSKKLRRIRSWTNKQEYLTHLVYQFARYKCGLPNEWGPDARVYSEALSNTKLFGKDAQTENDKVKDNIHSEFMKTAKKIADGRDIYCQLTLADTFGLHDEIKQAGLPAPERRKSRKKYQSRATFAPNAKPAPATAPQPARTTDSAQASIAPPAPAPIMSGLDKHTAIKAFRTYMERYPDESDRMHNTFSDWAVGAGGYIPYQVPAIVSNIKLLIEAEDPAITQFIPC